MEERVRLGLVVGAEDRVRLRDEHRHREVVAVRREALEVERRLGKDAGGALTLDDAADRVREAGVGACRDDVERVAEMPADGALGHVRADEPHLSLAVLAQAAEQGRGSGGAGGGDDDGDRAEAHARDRRRSSRLASNQALRRRISSPLPASHISFQPGSRSPPPLRRWIS